MFLPFSQANFAVQCSVTFRSVGKVFGTLAPNLLAMCSAVILASNNGSVVDLAGHCLYNRDKRVQLKKIMFCPQYYEGSCPAGKWAASSTLADPKWKASGDPALDYGIIVVSPHKKSTIADTVGASAWQYSSGTRFGNEEAYL